MKLANATMSAESIFFYMTITGLLLIPVALALTDFSAPINWGVQGPYLAAATQILNSVGALCLVYAFRYGKAIVVAPLANAGAPLDHCLAFDGAAGRSALGTKLAGVALAVISAILLAIEPEPGAADATAAAAGNERIMINRKARPSAVTPAAAASASCRSCASRGACRFRSLAEMFNVSTQTLRKDLNFLDSKGVCTRSPGGAILKRGALPPREDAIDVKRTLFADEKVRIGKAAAALIGAGESVLLDSGTTTLQVARHIDPEDALVVVTNDVGIMNELVAHEDVQLVFPRRHVAPEEPLVLRHADGAGAAGSARRQAVSRGGRLRHRERHHHALRA